jgi:energy-coupling factor transporter ATP-binding protein EcfA2
MIGQHHQNGRDYTSKLGITSLLDRDITRLSTGQWQRVAIAKVLHAQASPIILDEPDAPLDDHWSERLAMIIDEVISDGRVVVMTLHRPEIRTRWKFQRVNLSPVVIS